MEVIGRIHLEDERTKIDGYFANRLEDLGFTVRRDYRMSAGATTSLLSEQPSAACFSYYTGGSVSTAFSRDEGDSFQFLYTPGGYTGVPLWDNYTPTEEFYQLPRDLADNSFSSLEERAEMMAEALRSAMEESARIWLKDDTGFAPYRQEIAVAGDLSGPVYGAWLWAQTLRFEEGIGGSVNIAMPSILTQPWNGVSGSNLIYHMLPVRGIGNKAVTPNAYTGLLRPMRLLRAARSTSRRGCQEGSSSSG